VLDTSGEVLRSIAELAMEQRSGADWTKRVVNLDSAGVDL
jgi:hypothetical protein